METSRPASISSKTLCSNGVGLKQKGWLVVLTFCCFHLVYDHNCHCVIVHVASQAWALARLLPFMVGESIPTDNPHWCNFLLMLERADYLLAPEITEEEVACVKVRIQEHHETFKELYPEASIIPKMHYVVHMHRLILE